jgi:hypothetical protein
VDVAHVAPKVDRKPYPEHEKRNRRVLQHHYVLRRHTKATTQPQTHTHMHTRNVYVFVLVWTSQGESDTSCSSRAAYFVLVRPARFFLFVKRDWCVNNFSTSRRFLAAHKLPSKLAALRVGAQCHPRQRFPSRAGGGSQQAPQALTWAIPK